MFDGWLWASRSWLLLGHDPRLTISDPDEFSIWQTVAREVLKEYVSGQRQLLDIDFVVLQEPPAGTIDGVKRGLRRPHTVDMAVVPAAWLDASNVSDHAHWDHFDSVFSFLTEQRQLTDDERRTAGRLSVRLLAPRDESRVGRLVQLVIDKTWTAMREMDALSDMPPRPQVPAQLAESVIDDLFDPVRSWLGRVTRGIESRARAVRLEELAAKPRKVEVTNWLVGVRLFVVAIRNVVGRFLSTHWDSANRLTEASTEVENTTAILVKNDWIVLSKLVEAPHKVTVVDLAAKRFGQNLLGKLFSN